MMESDLQHILWPTQKRYNVLLKLEKIVLKCSLLPDIPSDAVGTRPHLKLQKLAIFTW